MPLFESEDLFNKSGHCGFLDTFSG
jgi:hypothetical protein